MVLPEIVNLHYEILLCLSICKSVAVLKIESIHDLKKPKNVYED